MAALRAGSQAPVLPHYRRVSADRAVLVRWGCSSSRPHLLPVNRLSSGLLMATSICHAGGKLRLPRALGLGALLPAGSLGCRDAPADHSMVWASSSHTANSISHRYHDFIRQRGSTAIRGIGSGGRRS